MNTKEEEHAKFTKEMQKRRRSRADKPFYPREIYYNTQATIDTIRHFVNGYGDVNPLYRDPEYAKKTKYGTVIAPPCFLFSIQWVAPGAGGAGIHGWYSGGQWQWFRPVHEGDKIHAVCCLRELVEKKGKMGGGKTWLDYSEPIYVNQKGEVVGSEKCWAIMAERTSSGSSGKYRKTLKPSYLSDRKKMQEIQSMYDDEEIRGKAPRYYEDVEIGEKLAPMLKGPLTVRDMVGWLMGAGSPFFKAHKIEYEYEKRHPKAPMWVSELGIWDVPEMVHILDEFAREIGVERAYDYGCQRMTWLSNLFTNWIGDDAWLWKMRGELRVFNQVGDITIFEGKVVDKYIDNGKCCIDIEAWAKNQRDENSMPPSIATVILPSRQHGSVVYPEVPDQLKREVENARPLNDLIEEGLI